MFRKLEPATEWGYNEIFQNRIVHLLETIVWQNATPSEKGKRAQHKAQQPVEYTPSFMKKVRAKNDPAKNTVSEDVDTIKALLARRRK